MNLTRESRFAKYYHWPLQKYFVAHARIGLAGGAASGIVQTDERRIVRTAGARLAGLPDAAPAGGWHHPCTDGAAVPGAKEAVMVTSTMFPAVDNGAVVRDALAHHDASLYAPNYVFHGPPELLEADCPSAYGALHGRAGGPFTEEELHVTDVAANGDRVVARFDGSGRHSGEYRGVAPNGQRRMAHVVAVYRMAEGRIAEGWGTLSWD